MTIRKEIASDIEKIWNVNARAFETEAEANLVDVLRKSGISYISLVAEAGEDIVGHIFFTPVDLPGDTSSLRIMGLAPMAVIPEMQNRGIGSDLVKAGIGECRTDGCDAIVVLGHANYYPRFGFVPSVNFGIISEYDVPDDVFMVLALRENAFDGKSGTVRYHAAFSEV